MQEFASGQSAHIANEGIKSSLKTREAAQQCAVLWFEDILNRKLYRQLGFSSINQYAKMELGFSKSHTGEFLALCKTFKRLPKVKEKVASGKLNYTSARVLGSILDEKNQDEWLASAENKSRRQLEKEVKRAKQNALELASGQASLMPLPKKKLPAAVVPVKVYWEMTPTQFARYEKLWEQVRKNRNASADRVEALLGMMESFAGEQLDSSPKRSARADLLPAAAKPPVQIHIHHCPKCAQATVQTGKGEMVIGKYEWERAQCDCQISEPGKPNKSSIPPAARRQVLAGARHKCQRPGCDHTQFLEVHHKTPRNAGGTNDPANLLVLCSSCHKLHHRFTLQSGGLQVKSPEEVYTWNTRTLLEDQSFPLPTTSRMFINGS